MKTIIGIICLLIFIPLTTFSQKQEIQARILDNSSNKPVAFVSVYSTTGQGLISDDAGFFRYQVTASKPADSLYFSCIGYESTAIAIADFKLDQLDTVYLPAQLFKLDEIQVKSKGGKKPKSKQILKKAIASVPQNYPDFPLKYRGYYREYVKHHQDYINLLESIIELRDSGISRMDDFAAGLLFKRSSPDFETIPGLMRPYNNVDKFVPYLVAPNTTANELVLLRNHDPIRNYNTRTLYHIDKLEESFIKNHSFNEPELSYKDDIAYYSIFFRDKKPLKKGAKEIVCEGTIYINPADYGIKKLTYRAFAEEGKQRMKLFDLNLEYEKEAEYYLLNHLSFNNLFMTRNFSMEKARVDSNKISLTFNQAFEAEGLQLEHFKVFQQDRELLLKEMQIVADSNKINLWVDGPEPGTDLSFEIKNMKDLNGMPLEEFGFKEYYQYRELFVRDFKSTDTEIYRNLIDKENPVFETPLVGEITGDTSWINTPLISEKYRSETGNLTNPVYKSAVENLYSKNEKTHNEIIYLHTDREVYAPSDTLWFKAYVRGKNGLDKSNLSQTLYLKVLNERGGTIEDYRFLLENSNASGQFLLDKDLEEGIYFLSAHTSWMENFDADQLVLKKILVRKERRPELQMELVLDRSTYYPGDTVKAAIHCYDASNRDVPGVRYAYRAGAGKKSSLVSGRARTEQNYTDTLKFVIPDQLDERPVFNISGSHRGQAFDTLYRLPVIRDIKVDFFPEGGKAINGLKTNINFKAQSLTGDPVNIKGNIVTRDGDLITGLKSEHDGMGAFTIIPRRDDSLFLRLTDPPGFDSLYPLPPGLEQGWQMSGTSTKENIFLEVQRKNTPGTDALITVMIRGYLYHYQEVKVKKNETISIPTEGLPAGIAVVTLYDHYMNPKAERLFYINPKGEVGVQMETSFQTYVPRDKVRLNINLKSDLSLKGSYSISVVDEQLGYTEFLKEANIRSSFLLSPEIKGKIHNPNSYMEVSKPGVARRLDLLLNTQGWRSYSYLNNTDWDNTVQRPVDKEMIQGTIFRQPFGKEAEASAGAVNVFYGGTSRKIPVNQNGRFAFTPEYEMKFNTGVLISAETTPPSNYVQLSIDESDFENQLMDNLAQMADSISEAINIPLLPYKSIADQFSLGLTYFEWIEEVEIVKKRIPDEDEVYQTIIEDFITMNKRESGPEDIEGAVDMIGILYNMGIPVEHDMVNDVIIHLGYPRSVIGWVVEDSYYGTRFSFVENFTPSSIKKVYLVKGFETMYFGANMPEVVISIRLNKFDPKDEGSDSSYSKHLIPAFEYTKEFYQPLYDTEERKKSQVPDLRKTIFWDPDLQIDEDGSSVVEFYNGDRYTRIKCILEGISDEGVPVYREYFYNVSLSRD